MDFWSIHSVWFIIFMFFFPRLTMLFMGICVMPFAHPVLFWFGWFFTPRLVIAILATTIYWDTNPVLCVLAWINAFFVGNASNKVTKDRVTGRRRREVTIGLHR
jgi:hypothetical protein